MARCCGSMSRSTAGWAAAGSQPADLPAVIASIDATAADGHRRDLVAPRGRQRPGALGRAAARVRGRPGGRGRHRPSPARAPPGRDRGPVLRDRPAYDMVRIGLGFYGEIGVDARPAPELASLAAELRPAMTVAARPARLEWMPAGRRSATAASGPPNAASRIATLPIGYADGWTRRVLARRDCARPRAAGPARRARVDGCRVRRRDRRATRATSATTSRSSSSAARATERITPVELARLRGTIPNEVFCDFGQRPRLERRVVGAGGGADTLTRPPDRA